MVISFQVLEIAEIVYLEPNKDLKDKSTKQNKKSISEIAQIYAMVTQGFVEMITLTLVGFFVGKYAIKQETWAAILAVFGAIIGLIIFLMLLFKLKLGGDSHGTTE